MLASELQPEPLCCLFIVIRYFGDVCGSKRYCRNSVDQSIDQIPLNSTRLYVWVAQFAGTWAHFFLAASLLTRLLLLFLSFLNKLIYRDTSQVHSKSLGLMKVRIAPEVEKGISHNLKCFNLYAQNLKLTCQGRNLNILYAMSVFRLWAAAF